MYLYSLLIFLPLIGSFCAGLFGRKLGPSGASIITVSCLLFGFIIQHIFFHSNYSLFSNQYTVILIFLFIVTLLSVIIVLLQSVAESINKSEEKYFNFTLGIGICVIALKSEAIEYIKDSFQNALIFELGFVPSVCVLSFLSTILLSLLYLLGSKLLVQVKVSASLFDISQIRGLKFRDLYVVVLYTFSNQYTVLLVFLLVAIMLENFLLFFQLLYVLPMSFLSFITWRSYYQVFSSCKIYLRCCLICWYHSKEGSAAKIKKWVQHSTIALIVMVREPKKAAEAQPAEKDSVIDSAEEGLDVPNLPAIESVTQKPVRGSIQGLIDAFSTLQGPTTIAEIQSGQAYPMIYLNEQVSTLQGPTTIAETQSGQVYPMICSDGKVLVVHDPTLFSSVSAVYCPSRSPMVTQYYGVLPTMGDYHSVSLMLAQNYSRIPIMEQNHHVGLTVARNCCPIPPTLPISGIRDVSVEVGASPFDRVSVFSKSLASTAMQFPLGGDDQPLLDVLPSDISNYANSGYMFSVEPLSPTVTLDHRSLPILNAYFQLNNLLTGCFRKDGVFILRGNHVHTGGKMSAAYPIQDDLEFCVVVSTLPEA